MRAGTGNPAALVGEFRRTEVYVPLVAGGGLMSGDFGGIRWLYAFTGEEALGRFLVGLGPVADTLDMYFTLPGARLLDVVIPQVGCPAGVAVDVADGERSMLFPPVRGIVPDTVAVNTPDTDADAGTAPDTVAADAPRGRAAPYGRATRQNTRTGPGWGAR